MKTPYILMFVLLLLNVSLTENKLTKSGSFLTLPLSSPTNYKRIDKPGLRKLYLKRFQWYWDQKIESLKSITKKIVEKVQEGRRKELNDRMIKLMKFNNRI